MELRTYKGLIRFILFLISVQLFSLATSPGSEESCTPNRQSFRGEHSKIFSLSVFLEESKTEKEGESEDENQRLLHCFEIADLSFVSQILVNAHTLHSSILPIEQQYDLKPPLFKLNKIFII